MSMSTCSGYFGPLGALVPVTQWQVDLAESGGVRSSDRVTLGGRRRTQFGAGNPRSWKVSAAGAGVDIDALRVAYARPAARVWVDQWVQASNVLTPAQAVPTGMTVTEGVLALPNNGGYATQIATATSGQSWQIASSTDPIPVVPGVQVTASIYAQPTSGSTATFTVYFVDAAGGIVSTKTSTSTGALLQRIVVTATPPTGAVGFFAKLINFSTGAAAQVTWTDSAVPWCASRGVGRVVLVDYDEQPEFVEANGAVNYQISASLLEVS